MKIIQLIPTLGYGGAEIMVENLSYKLKEKGHAVICVSLSGERTEIAKRMERNGISVLYLQKPKGFKPSCIYKLFRLFQREKPDVIHTHLHCTAYALPAAVLAGVCGRVHTLHSIAEKECGTVHKIINGIFFKYFDVVPVALSKLVQDTVVNTYRLPAKNIPVIYNGINISSCRVKEDVKLHSPVRLIHVGRFAPVKNHINLIKSFQFIHKVYPDSELLLLGDGPLKSAILEETKKAGLLPFVRFVGQTPEVFTYLYHSDIFLLPSNYEGMPITIIEAMGTGIPIAASPVGGIPEMLADHEDAVYCGTEPETICKAVLELIQSEKLRERISRNALNSVKRFASEEMANRYITLYQTLINGKGTEENK